MGHLKEGWIGDKLVCEVLRKYPELPPECSVQALKV
jgi:hypothetical protein